MRRSIQPNVFFRIFSYSFYKCLVLLSFPPRIQQLCGYITNASFVVLTNISDQNNDICRFAMKLDLISVVVLVFCLGVCISLFVEVRAVFSVANTEIIDAEAHQ